jgi:ubiquinone/menaquinone biosynthesis C-methylase UbiE
MRKHTIREANKMSDIKSAVQQQFEKAAANYRISSVHARGEDLQWMVQAANLSGNERVLDAGCGAGHTAVTFAPHVKEVIALDFTPAMLEQVEQLAAERQLSNVSTRHGDVEQLPFEPATFDLVVSRYSAHHWPHPLIALQEIARVLKPDGQFILSDVVASPEPLLDTFLQTIEFVRDPSHVRDHSIQQWQAMLAEVGFQSKVVTTWEIALNFDSWVQRIGTPAGNVATLHSLFAGASEEVRRAFRIQPNDFAITGALIQASLVE